MADQQRADDGKHAKVCSVSDEEKAAATAAAEPHPLAPLEAQLNGSTHNAGGAIKALEAWLAKELAKVRAEFSKGKDDEQFAKVRAEFSKGKDDEQFAKVRAEFSKGKDDEQSS
jgi:hypothetical protein